MLRQGILLGLLLGLFGSVARCAPPPAARSSRTSGEPAHADPAIIELERMIVEEKSTAAADAFGDKKLAESAGERVAEAALARASAANASDLAKGISGVTVSRDADGGSKITIRGMDARLNRLTIDGQRQSGTRVLDSLPPEIIKTFEVTKALTPDMDADAIGGAINVTTGDAADLKAPYLQGRHELSVNTSTGRPGWRNALTVGRPLRLFAGRSDKPNAGFVFGVNSENQFRARENIETNGDWPALTSPAPAEYAGQALPAYTEARLETTHDEAVKRGFLLNGDLRLGGEGSLFVRSNYSTDERRRSRERTFFDVGEGTALLLTPAAGLFSGVQLQQRNTRQDRRRELATAGLGGKWHSVRRHLEGQIGYARSTERDRSLDAAFRSQHPFRVGYDTRPDPYRPVFSFVDEVAPADATTKSDAAQYDFEQLDDGSIRTLEEEKSARLDFWSDLDDASRPSFLKFGAKLQQRASATRTALRRHDAGAAPFNLVDFVGQGATALRTEGYVVGPTPAARVVAARLGSAPESFAFNAVESELSSVTGTYSSTETVRSAYGMARVARGPWTWLGGMRVEATRYTARGNQLAQGNDGLPVGTELAQTKGDYVQFLPGGHLRFEPLANLLIRSSITRTLVRPNYRDLSPRRTINGVDRRIASGNPNLRPYEATNYDFSADWYHDRLGLLSLAPFYKEIAHYIVESNTSVAVGDRGLFNETRPANGDTARLWGVEAGWHSAPLAVTAIGTIVALEANYAFLHTVARLPDRSAEIHALPDQARHQVNVTLRGTRGPIFAEVSVRYRTDLLEEIVASGRDIYEEAGFETEISVAWKLNKTVKLTASAVNLSHGPDHIYSGDRSHQKEYEAAIVGFNFGVQWRR